MSYPHWAGLGALGEAQVTQDPQQTAGVYEEPAVIPFDKVLDASTVYTDLAQHFDKDADFLWTGICGTQTGAYQMQFILPDGRQMSPSYVNNANLVGTGQFPIPVFPAVFVGAGGKIGINIKDTSGAQNTVQICFVGLRRYRSRTR